jgi:TRAP-type C4-dicarboxylate transport system substrate-binding protein
LPPLVRAATILVLTAVTSERQRMTMGVHLEGRTALSRSIRIYLAAGLVALAAGASTSLAGPPQKTGSTVTLTLVSREERGVPSSMIAEAFAARVKTLSKGALVVRVVYLTRSGNAPVGFQEANLVRLVRTDKDALAIVPARAFQVQGVTSFEALQAPFLITTQAAMDRVTVGSIAARLQSGLPAIGLTGLGLAPEGLRRPFGLRKPLVSSADFEGISMLARPSSLTWALLHSLGVTPLDLPGPEREKDVENGTVKGVETSLALAADPALPLGAYTAGNLAFFPEVDALVANAPAWKRLRSEQRAILSQAASFARSWAVSALTEQKARDAFCKDGGTIVRASLSALAALRAKTAPVLAALRRDQLTRKLIDEIARAILPNPGVASCSHKMGVGALGGPTVDAVIPAGVYRSPTFTEQQLIALGEDTPGAKNNAGTLTLTVTADGYQSIHLDSPHPEDTATCANRKMYLRQGLVVIEERGPGCGGDLGVAWKLVRGGIEFTRVEPNIPGLVAYWAGVVWKRVG